MPLTIMKYIVIVLFGFLILGKFSYAQVKPVIRQVVGPPKDKKKFYLFLLAGQSNMAGRGVVEAADTLPNPKILVLNKNNEWEVAKEPIHFDRAYTGVGPALAFARSLAASDSTIYIGLIPCAVGGSGINSWLPADDHSAGGKNFANAIVRVQCVSNQGKLKAVLWAQGETDCTAKGVMGYGQKMEQVIKGLRQSLNYPDLNFVAALLPDFQQQQYNEEKILTPNPFVTRINEAIVNLKSAVGHYDYIAIKNAGHIGDHLHYDAMSARSLGRSYAEAVSKDILSHK